MVFFEMWWVVLLNGMIQNGNDLIIDMVGDGMYILGKSGCNCFNGVIFYNKKYMKIIVKEFGIIEMYCGEVGMLFEKEFFNVVLGKKFKIYCENGQWIWKCKCKQIFVMEFYELKVIIDLVFMEERIVWDYFSGKNLKVIQLDGNSMFEIKVNLIFDVQNNYFSGSNGCNQINGNFVSNGIVIIFLNVVLMKMKCNDQVDIIEKKIMVIFNGFGFMVDFVDQVMNIYDVLGVFVLMLVIDELK